MMTQTRIIQADTPGYSPPAMPPHVGPCYGTTAASGTANCTHTVFTWLRLACCRYRASSWVIPLIVVVSFLLLAVALAPLAPYLCCAPVQGGRPIAIQAMINMRKRFKGPPQGGNVAVVVTDIAGYSGG